MKTEKLKLLPPEELFGAINELLSEGYDAEFTVTGKSMWPLLAHGRDCVTLRKDDCPLTKGDIVLLKTENGYLLHRITALKNGMVQTTGDYNCYRDDFVSARCVLGRVVSFTRKGKKISCSNPLYRLSSWLWRVMFPLRPLLLRALAPMSNRTS